MAAAGQVAHRRRAVSAVWLSRHRSGPRPGRGARRARHSVVSAVRARRCVDSLFPPTTDGSCRMVLVAIELPSVDRAGHRLSGVSTWGPAEEGVFCGGRRAPARLWTLKRGLSYRRNCVSSVTDSNIMDGWRAAKVARSFQPQVTAPNARPASVAAWWSRTSSPM